MIISTADRSSLSLLEKQIILHHLNNGGILAFSTDTLYGVGVKAVLSQAVDQLYKVKGRDKGKPLILLGSTVAQFQPYISEPKLLHHSLMKAYWPGPLTVILPFEKRSKLYFGQVDPDSIGMRIPDNQVLLDLISFLDFPLLTTSANPSGASPFRKGHSIQNWLLSSSTQKIIILDGGEIDALPSTVIRLFENDRYSLIREGVISMEELDPFFSS
ncbi:MAG: L-threonylcarbamoyladenylate synthase [Caldisericia bacterium]|nr:L-threonylcarbamoyladenylate synthase [Caldisericia bacterium]